MHAAQRQAAAARSVNLVGDAAYAVAEELRFIGKGGEHGTDGVVRGHLLEVQLLGVDTFPVDAGAVACGEIVGAGFGQACEKRGFERRGLSAEDLQGELQHARRVGDHLYGLDAGDVIEKPSAAGEHKLRVALHLHEFQGADALAVAEWVRLLRSQEAIDRLRAAVEHHLDVGVARGPHIAKESAAVLLGELDQCIAQLVEGPAQRSAPLLVPAGMAAVAAAVGAPPLHAVHATP